VLVLLASDHVPACVCCVMLSVFSVVICRADIHIQAPLSQARESAVHLVVRAREDALAIVVP
jgi:hypothetical protein